jgi:O-acetylserine/cysteine efflux transporter
VVNDVKNRLPLSHLLLALAIVAIWGTNFVVIKKSLEVFPPFLFATLRYVFALLPAIFFVKRPQVSWLNLCLYGLFIGVGQFGILFYAINGHITPGLASLVVQTQVFFTIGFAMVFAKERINWHQAISIGIAMMGLLVIASHIDSQTSLLGMGLVICAGCAWGAGNTMSRQAGPINMFAYVVWASAFSIPPLLLLSLYFEGGYSSLLSTLELAPPGAWAGVFWQSWANTLFAYAAWAWLLSKYPAAVVAPAPLLVPIFGMGATAIFLGESLPGWKFLAAGLVMVGYLGSIYGLSFTKRSLGKS